ncbi:MAG: hypothetical protein AB8B82_00480 [Roseovarius sp.]
MTLLLCLVFFLGYLGLRSHMQALAFLAIGAGVQLMTYAVPAPDAATLPDTPTVILVCVFSALGYIAWRASRKRLESGLLSRTRVLIFLGWGANGVIFAFILWLTGALPF